LERAKSSDVDTFVHASADLAKADLFVAQFSSLVRDLSEIQAVWAMMGLCRLTSCIVRGDPRVSQVVSPSIARRIVGLSEAVHFAENRGVLLSRMSDGISARVAAALHMVNKDTSGLARRMIVSRMVWVVGHEQLDAAADLPWVATMLDLPLDAGVVHMVHNIAQIALEKSRERLGTRKERPADALLAQLLQNAVGDPLLNVGCGPTIVRMLPHLIDPKHIKGRVSDFRLAVRYLEAGSIRTVTSVWTDLVQYLAQWDVLASVARGFEPVVRTDVGWRLDQEQIPDGVRWSMRIPRSQPQREHTVVAVRMVELAAAGGGGSDVRAALQECWLQVAENQGVFTWIAEHGIAVFACPAEALRFAVRVSRNMIGSDGLLSTSTDPIVLPPGMRPSIGVAKGLVMGGTDGEHTCVDGPAVAQAMARCGSGRPIRCTDDPLQIRRVSAQSNGLLSHGVACGRPAMLAALNVWGKEIHRFGDESEVAGMARDFTTYPVDAWAPANDGVVLFISLGKHRGADLVEALWVDHHAQRDLQARDLGLDENEGAVVADEEPTLELEDPLDGDVGIEQGVAGEGVVEADEDPFGFDSEVATNEDGVAVQDKLDWGDIGFGDGDATER
jgi:hypothetical protein